MSAAVVEVLGVPVTRLTLFALIERVLVLSRAGELATVLYANVHVLNTAYTDPDLRRIMNAADVVYCDGAGVVLGARLLGHRLPERMTGADWIHTLCARCAAEGLSLYLLGSQPSVAERAAQELITLHPGLRIVGTHHGHFHDTPDATEATIAAVNATQPDILLVGMGTPLQEKWIAAHRAELDVPVVWAVGALFDFVAGVQPRGPRWMLDHGLEWLYRLLSNPRRLWHRYLIGNPLFMLRVLKQRITR
jgi:N-acetylglucosaminyldiphosphoundecaprenol N-acetyl-beta-D-mannosaminyltransferase